MASPHVRCIKDGKQWRSEHLAAHAQRVQEMKQHHVHTLNDKGERVPLTHCRRADNPKLYKAGALFSVPSSRVVPLSTDSRIADVPGLPMAATLSVVD